MFSKKYRLQLLAPLALAFMVSACGGEALVTNSSETVDTGFTANIQVVHHPIPNADGTFPDFGDETGKTFTNDLGFEVTLTMATLSFHQITLISEGDDPDCVAGGDQQIELNKTETLMGEDLLTSALANTSVEDRAYCQWSLLLEPTNHEHSELVLANTSDGEHDHEMTTGEGNITEHNNDQSLHLMGAWSKDGQSGNFMLATAESIAAAANFKAKVDGEVSDHALHFHEGETEITVLIGTKYNQLLNGIDFENDSDVQMLDQVITNIESGAVHQHLGEHHSS